jgi:thiamine-phosphate pyrophosphorylase
MKLIVITTEHFFDGEAAALNLLFDNGMELLHLRKPEASEAETAHFLEQIQQKYHPRIVIHDHYSLINRFHLKGIHLNRRNTSLAPVCNRCVPLSYTKSLSCHTLDEIEQHPDMDYLFLSPIFDSISKQNYASRFPESLLYALKEKGVIHEKIIALGGVNQHNISKVKEYGFGGAAVLGGLWEDFQNQQDTNILLTRFQRLQHAAAQ